MAIWLIHLHNERVSELRVDAILLLIYACLIGLGIVIIIVWPGILMNLLGAGMAGIGGATAYLILPRGTPRR